MKKISYLLFIVVFVCTFILTSQKAEAVFASFCSSSVGVGSWCNNNATVQDSKAYFSNRMADNYRPLNAYEIYFTQTRWTPNVTRGVPMYTYYFLYDNKNSKYYRYDQHHGKRLTDYSQINTGIGRTVDYYPASYQRPTTNLIIRNVDSTICGIGCVEYTWASQFDIN